MLVFLMLQVKRYKAILKKKITVSVIVLGRSYEQPFPVSRIGLQHSGSAV